jgi:hypothetical protein
MWCDLDDDVHAAGLGAAERGARRLVEHVEGRLHAVENAELEDAHGMAPDTRKDEKQADRMQHEKRQAEIVSSGQQL